LYFNFMQSTHFESAAQSRNAQSRNVSSAELKLLEIIDLKNTGGPIKEAEMRKLPFEDTTND
ncbi:hypothetical protein Dimus_037792, partial [Dionaea muscipula]